MPDTPGTDLAPAYDDDLMVGMEDFDVTDHVMPRLQIVHKEGLFKDGLSGETFETLECVILGLVKQRVMWDPDVDNNASPLCKSHDHITGHANPKSFPWKASGFNPANYDDDDPTLTCADCALKEWGTAPNGDNPWCTEQFTLVLMQPIGDGYAPSLLSIQRSGIKPIKSYLSAFSRSRTPLFTVSTTISLSLQRKGQVDYSVPSFVKGESTDDDLWSLFANNYREIRATITTAPAPRDDDGAATPVADPKPKAAAKKKKKAEVVEPEPEPEPDDDEPEPEPEPEPKPKTRKTRATKPEPEPEPEPEDEPDEDDELEAEDHPDGADVAEEEAVEPDDDDEDEIPF